MNEITKTATDQINPVFNDATQIPEGVRAFLEGVLQKNPWLMSVFEGTEHAAEKETIVQQTISGILKTGKPFNKLKLASDNVMAGVHNSSSLKYLVDEGYMVVSEDESMISLTNKMLFKLIEKHPPEQLAQSSSFLTGQKDDPSLPVLLPLAK
ncbi:MAG: hypothetical protein R3E13_09290 [Alphaproteobacteria bacterium]